MGFFDRFFGESPVPPTPEEFYEKPFNSYETVEELIKALRTPGVIIKSIIAPFAGPNRHGVEKPKETVEIPANEVADNLQQFLDTRSATYLDRLPYTDALDKTKDLHACALELVYQSWRKEREERQRR